MPNCQGYILNRPYPPVGAARPDPSIARQLLALYAGPNGELTAITQYLYNSLLCTFLKQTDLSDLFACVSRVEMHHLELLGRLILAYGGDPGFLYYPDARRTAWWTGAAVSYDKRPAQMLRDAVRAERTACTDYRRFLSTLKEPEPRAVIERILADEEHHVALLTDALAKQR